MALFDVSGFKSLAELRAQILPAGPTRLVDRTNHYTFGTKTQEFSVPVGADVSIRTLWRNLIHSRSLNVLRAWSVRRSDDRIILRVCWFQCVVRACFVWDVTLCININNYEILAKNIKLWSIFDCHIILATCTRAHTLTTIGFIAALEVSPVL